MERSTAVVRREIARVEAAQNRPDYHIAHRERTVAAAAVDAANAAAVAPSAASRMSLEHHHSTNGRISFHTSEDMQRMNRVWARQETLHMSSSDRVKMYDGDKYERKVTGPFMGKLVSQGRIINIDGDDYIEYRVLTKPSFF
ncbi:hypothetical protein MGU_11549 [Metarhizium guizhouense ARSEF 977]|uniref:Uncharacterized protein n=1 Tax=Metarhizium guizhouense (strain ARSEF 977) TaxID=1276136 RepID=A0A0B4HNS3_METGA|nr:hypothetical protein MGU_11549 [Metarhizium guizhouense ARSEF 977]